MLSELIPKLAGMEQKEQGYRHRCSGATYGEKCIRQQVYHALGIEPEPFPDRAMLIFDDSSWHETLTSDWIQKSIYKLHSEQMKVTPFNINGIPVTGSIDGILTDPEGKDILYEHKAINHFTFTSYEEGNLLPYDYVTQCTLYIVGIKKITDILYPGLLLIKNKNTARYIEYHIEYDDQEDIAKVKLYTMVYDNNELGSLKEVTEFFMADVVAKARNRFENIDTYVKEKKLPKRQYSVDNWHCQYCRWAGVCYKNYEVELDERKEITIKDKEITDKVYKYREILDKMTECEKEKELLKKELSDYMRNKEASVGVVNEYIVRLDIKEKSNLNKSLLPQDLIIQCTKKTKYESLSVTKFKEKVTEKTKKGGKKNG